MLIFTAGDLAGEYFDIYIKNFLDVIKRSSDGIYLAALSSRQSVELKYMHEKNLTAISINRNSYSFVRILSVYLVYREARAYLLLDVFFHPWYFSRVSFICALMNSTAPR